MPPKPKPTRIRQKRAARRVVEHAADVATKAMAIAAGDPLPPDPEVDTEAPEDLPALPASPASAVFGKPEPASAEMAAIASDVPKDPLAAMTVIFNLLARSAIECVADEDLSAKERRKELRTIGVSMDRLVPRARIYSAEQTVLNARRKLEQKKASNGAKLEARPGKPAPKSSDDPDFGDA